VLNGWFGKFDDKGPQAAAAVPVERYERKNVSPSLETFERIYEGAPVKPPGITYGIQKVADMADSPHLAGMSAEFKRKALLMALHAANTDEGEVLNDLVIRQRILKEYEESFTERMNQFEDFQIDQNRQQQAELDVITAQYMARIRANQEEVEKCHREFRAWQENKRQELQRFTETAALCVPQESTQPIEAVEEEEMASNVMPMLRPTGTFR
jgi:hypothetical protein